MHKHVAAFGEVMMRLQVPGYDTLAQADTLRYTFSGTGVNIVSALARFGHTGYLVTMLPDNPLGEAAIAYLRKLGISTTFIQRGGRFVGMYFLENGFGMRPSRVTYTDRLGSSFNQAPLDSYDPVEIAGNVDIMHFCGITLAMNDTVRGHMKRLAAAVKQAGGKVVFDCNFRPALWGDGGYAVAKPHYEEMLDLADIVMMNEKDALHILGLETQATERKEQLLDLIPQVASKFGIAVVAGTHRSINRDNSHSLQGYIYKKGQFEFSDTLNFMVYDRIGAGDAYASGIIHGEIWNFSAKRTVDFAAAAAALAHTVSGDTPNASEAEVMKAMTQMMPDVER
ncbi:sugar kinase [Paenibacillus sp. P96]|uniref:Sugar kinase n=1 Tax=Paenibacillus zeirhizosphaerae TaxID=2987519 RepID=A0ABT9FQN6_9BACL|nr:sugar kinase [Paenibacillus sp. P96]MDP4097058.1 sugar kinase [Paenibacillus sp. P96]